MQLGEVRNVYEQDGPFATVYMEARSPAEDAEQQIRLRWDDLKGRLADAGTDDEVLLALENAVIVEDIGEVQNNGRVLVANSSGVLLHEDWDAALGAGDAVHYTAQPELGPYVRERARSVRLLVAIADRTGATVRRVTAAEQHVLNEHAEDAVSRATDESVHKPREGAMSHKQIQRRADEAVKKNVREVADYLEQVASSWRPDLVVIAGEVQGRKALRDELPEALHTISREAERGGTDDEGAEEALAEELRTIADDFAAERSQELTERFEHAKAHDLAAEGAEAVARAAQMGAIETLLFEYERSAVDEAKVLSTSVQGDAQLGLLEDSVADAVAAVLRFEAPAEING